LFRSARCRAATPVRVVRSGRRPPRTSPPARSARATSCRTRRARRAVPTRAASTPRRCAPSTQAEARGTGCTGIRSSREARGPSGPRASRACAHAPVVRARERRRGRRGAADRARGLLRVPAAPPAPELLVLALTHRSFAHENGGIPTNERLEFLGDTVLGLVVTETLYRRHPDLSEGELAKMR